MESQASLALEYTMKQGKGSRVCQENALVIRNPSSNNTIDNSTQGHHLMVSTKIRLIIFFAAEDGEALIQTWS